MIQRGLARLVAAIVLGCTLAVLSPALRAQPVANQGKPEELAESAKRFEQIGYVVIGIGLVLVIAGIPYAIYADRRKKARKLAEQAERQRRDQ